jgi:SAM-dependent methyltransferase
MPTISPHLDTIRCDPNPKCIACGHEGVELYRGLTDSLAGTPGTWRMVRCPNARCGMLWLDPKPVADDLIKAYRNYHTHGRARARPPVQLGLSALNTTCKLVSRVLESGSDLGRQRQNLRTMFLADVAPGSLLEVGCGSGRFLNRMREAGWQVKGTDFDPAVAARVKERYALQVDIGDLQDLGYAAGSYDAIAMSQVIEHVPDPIVLLQECLRLLRPDGRLVLSTPNANGIAHRRYGRHWRGLEPPRHLHVFTPAALQRCARVSGFERLKCFTLSAEAAGIYRASDAIAQAEGGPGSASQALSVVRSWVLRYHEYRASLRDGDAGQDTFLIAVKGGALKAVP